MNLVVMTLVILLSPLAFACGGITVKKSNGSRVQDPTPSSNILPQTGRIPTSTQQTTATDTSTITQTDTEADLDDAGEQQGLANLDHQQPQAFSITAPRTPLNAKAVIVQWEASEFAVSFDVTIAKDQACADGAVTKQNIKATRTSAEAVVDGINYVCVVANGQYGDTPASNNGFTFQADISGPEKPAAPSLVLDGNIGLHMTWLPVQDVGAAGLARYGTEITTELGKANGQADVFNAELSASETSKDAVGFRGETYYSRIRGIDHLGNEGPWSDWSRPLTIP